MAPVPPRWLPVQTRRLHAPTRGRPRPRLAHRSGMVLQQELDLLIHSAAGNTPNRSWDDVLTRLGCPRVGRWLHHAADRQWICRCSATSGHWNRRAGPGRAHPAGPAVRRADHPAARLRPDLRLGRGRGRRHADRANLRTRHAECAGRRLHPPPLFRSSSKPPGSRARSPGPAGARYRCGPGWAGICCARTSSGPPPGRAVSTRGRYPLSRLCGAAR